jgi:hypothetical protein
VADGEEALKSIIADRFVDKIYGRIIVGSRNIRCEIVETKLINDWIFLHFPPEERECASVIEKACEQSVALIGEIWGLSPPKGCHVFIATSWLRFVFQSAPWYIRIPCALQLPFVYSRFQKAWKFSSGWTMPYPGSPAIGIKPPSLIAKMDRSISEMIFSKGIDTTRWTALITCHEMTHVFSAHLKLPLWLNEGIAMVTVDRFYGGRTVKADTLTSLSKSRKRPSVDKYRNLLGMRNDDVAYQYVRGYWITRYLEDVHPLVLQEIVKGKRRHSQTEKMVADALSIKQGAFWSEIDRKVFEHFERTPPRPPLLRECQPGPV